MCCVFCAVPDLNLHDVQIYVLLVYVNFVVCKPLLKIIDMKRINEPEMCLVLSYLKYMIEWYAALNGIDVY